MGAKKKTPDDRSKKELDLVEIRLVVVHNPEGKLDPHAPTSAAIDAVNALRDTFVISNVSTTTKLPVDLPNKLGDRSF